MASIRKHKKSSYWYACITLPDGKQRQFSTGLTDEKEAEAVATAAERAARHHTAPHQLRTALERIAEDFTPENEANPSDWILLWSEGKKPEVEKSTFDKYNNTATEAAAFLKAEGVKTFAAITPGVVTRLRNYWSEKASPGTANGKLKVFRMMLEQCRRDGLIPMNPAEDVASLKNQATRRREFRPAELDLLIPTLSGEWRAIFFLGLYTGQRLNDLAILTWRHVDLEKRTVSFVAKKTDAVVALPLMQTAVDALAELPSSDKPDARIFPKIAKIKGPGRSNAFRNILSKVGLARHSKAKAKKEGARTTSELSFHSLRHTATSMLKAAGVSDSIARAIIGHESVAVSRSYTHLDLATMREAMEKMPVR